MTPDPDCPADRHRSVRAHREHGCVCPGESWDRWLVYRRKQTEAHREAERERSALRRATGAVAPVVSHWRYVATDARRRLRERDDLACRGLDPELFHVDGDERVDRWTAMRVETARRVCQRCPARQLCLSAAFEQPDPWAFLGGMSPRERFAVSRGAT